MWRYWRVAHGGGGHSFSWIPEMNVSSAFFPANLCEAIQCNAMSRALLVNVIWLIEIMYFLCMLHVQHITKKHAFSTERCHKNAKHAIWTYTHRCFRKHYFYVLLDEGENFLKIAKQHFGVANLKSSVSLKHRCVSLQMSTLSKIALPCSMGSMFFSYVLVCIFDCYVYCYLYWSQCLHV